MKDIKTAKQIERHVKGMANHRRIEILFFVEKNPRVTLEEITDHLKANIKTISEHARRLALAGLVNKRYHGREVEHSLSPYGKTFVRFLRTFSYS